MNPYEDILHRAPPVSEKRAKMPLSARAAQFSPFAALTGYEGIIAETGRRTERCIDLDEEEISQINARLLQLAKCIDSHPTITVTYFLPDPYKDGGSYETVTGQLKRLDPHEGCLIFTDRTQISFSQILNIQ